LLQRYTADHEELREGIPVEAFVAVAEGRVDHARQGQSPVKWWGFEGSTSR